jgi:carboxypeptidase family protein/TonB-dependent receptor-like protein
MNASRCYAIACIAALALGAGRAGAQRVTVRGQVTDAENGHPLIAAVVRVGDDRHEALTDARGRFEVRGVTPGERMVWASATGYRVSSGPVTVADSGATMELALDRDPVRLAALVATANRFESRRRAYGGSARVITEAQIAGSAAVDMLDFVETDAGIHRAACPGSSARLVCVWSRGGLARASVYVDEVPWSDLDLLSAYRPADVARVEVYSGGRQIRVYTRQFLAWAADHNYRPMPLWLNF